MSDTTTEIAEYHASLDAALTKFMQTGSTDAVVLHAHRWGVDVPSDPETLRVALLKGVSARTTLPMEMRTRAKRELMKGGFRPWDDGDVPA